MGAVAEVTPRGAGLALLAIFLEGFADAGVALFQPGLPVGRVLG